MQSSAGLTLLEITLKDLAHLIQDCARGDQTALRTIMSAEGGQMLGVAQRMLRRRDLAEDAVQDSLVLIWRKSDQFDAERGNAKAWLYTVLRNRCLTMLRKESWEIATEAETLEYKQDNDVVAQAYERLGSTSDLRRCLSGLDAEKRRAVLLSYVMGYTHGEISGRLKAPLGSVKSWLRRGLTQLRECMP